MTTTADVADHTDPKTTRPRCCAESGQAHVRRIVSGNWAQILEPNRTEAGPIAESGLEGTGICAETGVGQRHPTPNAWEHSSAWNTGTRREAGSRKADL